MKIKKKHRNVISKLQMQRLDNNFYLFPNKIRKLNKADINVSGVKKYNSKLDLAK